MEPERLVNINSTIDIDGATTEASTLGRGQTGSRIRRSRTRDNALLRAWRPGNKLQSWETFSQVIATKLMIERVQLPCLDPFSGYDCLQMIYRAVYIATMSTSTLGTPFVHCCIGWPYYAHKYFSRTVLGTPKLKRHPVLERVTVWRSRATK